MPSIPPDYAQQTPSNPGFFRWHRRTTLEAVDKKRRVAILLSYSIDWVLTLVIAGVFFILDSVEPFKREFSLNDTSIQHTFAEHERVSNTNLILIAVVAPLILIVAVNMMSIRSFWDCHTGWLGGALALALAGTITNIVKVTVGRPRPDCIDRCQPRPGSTNQAVFGLVNATICTQTDNAILKDGFRSFPSGHSSLSFAGLGFLFFYLAGKLHLFDHKGYTGKAWIAAVPLMGAGLVAISRTMDYRHHWQDVLVGSLLGLFLAWFSYRQYYPPLSHPLSHRPYSPRISRNRHFQSGTCIHDRPDLNDETEHLHPPRDSRGSHSDHIEEMPMHMNPQRTSTDGVDGPTSLKEVWKEGEGEEILPPGRTSSPGKAPSRDELV